MSRIKQIALLAGVGLMLCCAEGMGQDPQFSQFYATPLYLNPAFTGNTVQGRVAGTYRKQWMKVPGAFTSYTFSYDHFLQKYNSGLGLLFVRDQAGSGALQFNSIGGLYSYAFNVTRTVGIRAGIRAAYSSRSLNFYLLKFADQIIRDDPFHTIETYNNQGRTYFDFGSGLLVYSGTYWAGFAVDHLNRPDESLVGQEARIPVKYSVQGGYRYVVVKGVKGNSEQDLTAVVNYKAEQDWDQVDIGAYYKYKMLLGGLWYRGIPGLKAYKPGYANNDALVAMVSVQVDDFFHIGYSYDATISRLGLSSRGAHEISLMYEFAQPEYKRNGKKQNFMVPCTKF